MIFSRSWLLRQDNKTFFLVVFVAVALLSLCLEFLMFGDPLTRHLPAVIGGSLAFAYVAMLGRTPKP